MRDIRDNMNQEARDFGIKVVDVRIQSADLPENSDFFRYFSNPGAAARK